MTLFPNGDGIEHGIAIAHVHRFDGHGIPSDVSQATHGGKRVADLVPIVARADIGGSPHASEARRVRRDGATVLHIQRD